MTDSLPHLSTEFFTWLWWASEHGGGRIDVDGEEIILWVDDRPAFRLPSEDASRAVLTGADTARAAEEGGASRWEGRQGYAAAPPVGRQRIRVHPSRAPASTWVDSSFPRCLRMAMSKTALMVRMEAIEALWVVLGALYRQFAEVRTQSAWTDEVVPAIQAWLAGDA